MKDQALQIYLILTGLTLVTWGAGRTGISGLYVALTILFLALFKGQLVGDYFMHIKGIRSWWRWVIFFWLLLIAILISTAFILSGTD